MRFPIMMIKEINLAESAEHLEDPRVSVTKCQVLINPYNNVLIWLSNDLSIQWSRVNISQTKSQQECYATIHLNESLMSWSIRLD